MNKLNFDYEIRKINNTFFEKYNKEEYPEIEIKKSRPYNFVLFETKYDYFVAVPFRTNVKHNNAFKFVGSSRNRAGASGLDYSKLLIIKNPNDIGEKSDIEKDEYSILVKNIVKIGNDINEYIDDYRNHILGRRIVKLSAIVYYKILHLA